MEPAQSCSEPRFSGAILAFIVSVRFAHKPPTMFARPEILEAFPAGGAARNLASPPTGWVACVPRTFQRARGHRAHGQVIQSGYEGKIAAIARAAGFCAGDVVLYAAGRLGCR